MPLQHEVAECVLIYHRILFQADTPVKSMGSNWFMPSSFRQTCQGKRGFFHQHHLHWRMMNHGLSLAGKVLKGGDFEPKMAKAQPSLLQARPKLFTKVNCLFLLFYLWDWVLPDRYFKLLWDPVIRCKLPLQSFSFESLHSCVPFVGSSFPLNSRRKPGTCLHPWGKSFVGVSL